VAFEGIDGAGKSVQIRLTEAWLTERGAKVRRLFEPTSGPIGSKIRELAGRGRDAISPEEEFRLFLDDRRWNVETNIRPALERGEVVLLDRYYISSIAYQGALGLDPERIRRENEAFAPIPDRVLLLELPPEQAETRIRAGRGDTPNLFERTEYLARVAEIFDSLTMLNILRLDATLPIQTIQQAIRRNLAGLLGLSQRAED
jgi:dTMP kinase